MHPASVNDDTNYCVIESEPSELVEDSLKKGARHVNKLLEERLFERYGLICV